MKIKLKGKPSELKSVAPGLSKIGQMIQQKKKKKLAFKSPGKKFMMPSDNDGDE